MLNLCAYNVECEYEITGRESVRVVRNYKNIDLIDCLIALLCQLPVSLEKMQSQYLYKSVVALAIIFVHVVNTDPGPCALLDSDSSPLCISLAEINQAFRKARLAHGLLEPTHFSPHKSHKNHHHIDKLGLVLVETSRILAKSFDLDYHQLYDLLPQLDLELTEIWKFCPAQFKDKKCKVSKYRTLSGHCNNLNHPDWGASFAPFAHILPPSQSDGLSEPRDYGKDHSPLPSARLVSSHIHQDKVVHDHAVTIMLIAWGQIIDHDVTFTAETKETASSKDPNCCSDHAYESKPKHHNCYPITIPDDDPFYSYFNHHCMSFTRSFAGVRPGCKLGPRTAFNTISSFLDANFLYGSNIELGKKLRSGKYGTLRTLPLFEEYGLKDVLPLKVDEPDDGCIRPNSDIFCFLAGDNRVNEQLVLTTLHTIFMRQHNQYATSLAEINPHWDDEKLYQETRRLIIAITQHVTYNEFLPMILGRKLLHKFGISVEEGYWTGYDPYKNPGASDEFITSAFRFGHSLLPNKIERWTTSHHYIDSTKLHEMLRQPFDMFRPGYADSFIMGLVNQLAQVMDEGVTDQVTTLLFKEQGKKFGMDLAAMNIQRGRDHGIAPYAAYREICDLPRISHWDDLIGIMRNETVYHYKLIYRSPWDIDLWSGGVSEIPTPGSLIGPTFGCLIAKQFQSLRYGDRFWYELPDLPSSFTLEQLNEIKNIKLSRLLCDNGDAIKTIQLYAMVHPDHHINPRVSCHSQVLPKLDLEKWRESGETHYTGIFKEKGKPSVLKQAHLSSDLEILKPPLYDSSFLKPVKTKYEGEHHEETPATGPEYSKEPQFPENHHHEHKTKDSHPPSPYKAVNKSVADPFSYEKHVPPFRKIPDEVLIYDKKVVKTPENISHGPPYGDVVFYGNSADDFPPSAPPFDYDFPPFAPSIPPPP
ncbi:Chorion peroxidase, partial [Orchesella cincta]